MMPAMERHGLLREIVELKASIQALEAMNAEFSDLCDGHSKRVSLLEAELIEWQNEAPFRKASAKIEALEAENAKLKWIFSIFDTTARNGESIPANAFLATFREGTSTEDEIAYIDAELQKGEE